MAETGKNIEYMDGLIIKYLSGHSTGEEENEILSWISNNPENRKHFQQVSDIWNISILPAQRNKIDSTKAFNEFEKKRSKSQKRTIPLWIYSAAASILLLISFIALENYKFDKKELLAKSEVVTNILPDGTEVELNQNSSLTYYVKKLKRKRCAYLVGEAYFDVKHDKSKPFIVYADGIQITVTGTSFNVNSGGNSIEISLVEGSISVNYCDTAKTFNLKAGESLLVNKKTRVIEFESQMDVNNLTWKTNELIFKNSSLNDVLSRLEKIYNISFSYNSSAIESLKFDGRLSTEDLDVILSTIEITFNLTITPEGENNYSIQLNS